MTTIERTAYPRFRANISHKEIEQVYTPTQEELAFVAGIARPGSLRLNALVELKCFQRLGYFPDLGQVPSRVVHYIRKFLPDAASAEAPSYDQPRTHYRHRDAIRQHLGVKSYREGGRATAKAALQQAAQTMGNPADLINAAIEELVRQNYERPAFSQLDRLTRRIRAKVNGKLHQLVLARLKEEEKDLLDRLPELQDQRSRTDFTAIKDPAGRASLTHMREMGFG